MAIWRLWNREKNCQNNVVRTEQTYLLDRSKRVVKQWCKNSQTFSTWPEQLLELVGEPSAMNLRWLRRTKIKKQKQPFRPRGTNRPLERSRGTKARNKRRWVGGKARGQRKCDNQKRLEPLVELVEIERRRARRCLYIWQTKHDLLHTSTWGASRLGFRCQEVSASWKRLLGGRTRAWGLKRLASAPLISLNGLDLN